MLRSATLLALSLLTACASSPTAVTAPEQLAGGWQLATGAPAGARIPTLSIGRDGHVSGNAGINRFQGSLDLQALLEGRFQLGQLSGTEMAGTQEAMQFEMSFLRALGSADAATVEGRLLQLRQGGQPVLDFTRVTGR